MRTMLYVLYYENPDKTSLDNLITIVSKETKSRITKSRFLIDKWRILLSDILIRSSLAKELNVSPLSIEIEIGVYGKPILKSKKRHFNLSHSHNVIVLTTDDSPIGIDVEHIKPLTDLADLISQFTKEEQQAFKEKSKNQQIDFFYELWTLKESYLKAIGKGLNISLQSFSIKVTDEEVTLSNSTDTDEAWYFKRYNFDSQFKCAVCSRHKNLSNQAIFVKTNDLIKVDLI